MTCARLVLVATLATMWIIGSCSAAAAEDSTQITPSRSADVVVPKGALNITKVGVSPETEAEKKRRLRLQRKREKKERRRQKKLLRKKRRRERKLRKLQQRALKGDDKPREGKGKKQKKKKRGKRRKKQKNKDKKKKNKRKRKKKKDRRRKRKDKKRNNGKRKKRRKNRRKNKSRKRPFVPCKTDADCEKAGPRYCCQLISQRCVKPRGGLKCFGSCMCNARKQTENFLCVTKKKKYEKFLNQKKLGKVTYEKPRGHCSNVTVSELQDPKHRYQQIV